MGRVSQKKINQIKEFIDLLPEKARNKCSLCNDTFTQGVKQAKVKTGAGTRTITRVFADEIKENAAPSDKVSGEALQQRVLEKSGEKNRIGSNGTNKSDSSQEET